MLNLKLRDIKCNYANDPVTNFHTDVFSLQDSQHVAILSRQCSTSEVLDLATMMITSMISNTATLPLDGDLEHDQKALAVDQANDNLQDLNKALHHPDKTVKIYNTIQDFNPNPNLLSKKAIKNRKKKIREKYRKYEYHPSYNPKQTGRNALGGRQQRGHQNVSISGKIQHVVNRQHNQTP